VIQDEPVALKGGEFLVERADRLREVARIELAGRDAVVQPSTLHFCPLPFEQAATPFDVAELLLRVATLVGNGALAVRGLKLGRFN